MTKNTKKNPQIPENSPKNPRDVIKYLPMKKLFSPVFFVFSVLRELLIQLGRFLCISEKCATPMNAFPSVFVLFTVFDKTGPKPELPTHQIAVVWISSARP